MVDPTVSDVVPLLTDTILELLRYLVDFTFIILSYLVAFIFEITATIAFLTSLVAGFFYIKYFVIIKKGEPMIDPASRAGWFTYSTINYISHPIKMVAGEQVSN